MQPFFTWELFIFLNYLLQLISVFGFYLNVPLENGANIYWNAI